MYKAQRTVYDFLFLLVFAGFIAVSQLKYGPLSQGRRDLIAPPRGIEHFAFGFNEVISDLMWIRAIQDFDYCSEKISQNLCVGNGWLYKMLDAITELSPFFKIVYQTGGLALTVLVSDYEGASKFFDKSVARNPTDWLILYRASYHYLYEEKNKEKAAEHLRRAARHGAPSWTYNLAGRLYTDSQSMDLAKAVLQEMIDSQQDEQLIQRLQEKIKSSTATSGK